MLYEYTLANVKGVKKSFDNAAEADILKWRDARLFNIVETIEWSEIFNSTESMDGIVELAENETPPTCSLDEGYQVTLSPKRFGGAIEITENDMQRAGDSTVLIDQFIERKRTAVLRAARHKFLGDIFYMYNNAFNSSALTLAPDGVELCGTHSWSTAGAATWSNKATAVLSGTAIEALEEYAGAFTDAKGTPIPLTFDTIVVKKGSANAREAKKLFGMYGMKPTAVNDINIYEGEYTLIETPYITTANKNYWFALAVGGTIENPLYVGIHKMPSMNEPIRDKNESVYSSVTMYYKTGINNLPINVFGSDGTTV
jgi:hypothetical protein